MRVDEVYLVADVPQPVHSSRYAHAFIEHQRIVQVDVGPEVDSLKRDVQICAFTWYSVEGVITLLGWLRSLRGFSRLCTVPVLGWTEET